MLRFFYFAAPYTSPEPGVQEARVEAATRLAAQLMDHRTAVYSPLTHGHQFVAHLPEDLADNHGFWMQQCLPMLQRADAIVLYPRQGWRQSRGVQWELTYAESSGIPVILLQVPGDPECELFTPTRDLFDYHVELSVKEML